MCLGDLHPISHGIFVLANSPTVSRGWRVFFLAIKVRCFSRPLPGGIFHFTKISRIFYSACRRSFLFTDNCLRFPQRSTNLSSRLSSNCPLPSSVTVTIGDRFLAPFAVPVNSRSYRPAPVHYSLPMTG